jgi:hypothetical protein
MAAPLFGPAEFKAGAFEPLPAEELVRPFAGALTPSAAPARLKTSLATRRPAFS